VKYEDVLNRQGRFVASDNDEIFSLNETFLTRESAVESAIARGKRYVGQIDVPDPTAYVDAEKFIESVVCDNEPFLSEWFDGYLSDGVTVDDRHDLELRLAAAFRAWLDENDFWPDVANIENVQEVAK